MSYIRKHSKTGIYWYRRAIPRDLVGRLPPIDGFADRPDRVELTKTLRTKNQAQANRLAGVLDALVEAAIAGARKPQFIPPNAKGTENSVVLLAPDRVKVRFSPSEVVALWNASKASKNPHLADLIRLAAFTGGRIEALCALDARHVLFNVESQCHYLHIEKDKTLAGVRDVPIHSSLLPLIKRLKNESSTRSGFLIPSHGSKHHRR